MPCPYENILVAAIARRREYAELKLGATKPREILRFFNKPKRAQQG